MMKGVGDIRGLTKGLRVAVSIEEVSIRKY